MGYNFRTLPGIVCIYVCTSPGTLQLVPDTKRQSPVTSAKSANCLQTFSESKTTETTLEEEGEASVAAGEKWGWPKTGSVLRRTVLEVTSREEVESNRSTFEDPTNV